MVVARGGVFLQSSSAIKEAGETVAKEEVQKDQPALSNVQKLYAAGGILDVFAVASGSMAKASAIRTRGKFEEAAFMENSRRLKKASKEVLERGRKDVHNFMQSIRKLEGAQVAAMAAQGIDVGRGTAAAIREETIETGIEDASTIRSNAYKEAFGLRQQAIEQETQARLTRVARKFRERQEKLKGITQITSSLFSTAGSIAGAGGAGGGA